MEPLAREPFWIIMTKRRIKFREWTTCYWNVVSHQRMFTKLLNCAEYKQILITGRTQEFNTYICSSQHIIFTSIAKLTENNILTFSTSNKPEITMETVVIRLQGLISQTFLYWSKCCCQIFSTPFLLTDPLVACPNG